MSNLNPLYILNEIKITVPKKRQGFLGKIKDYVFGQERVLVSHKTARKIKSTKKDSKLDIFSYQKPYKFDNAGQAAKEMKKWGKENAKKIAKDKSK